jgi:hypothetical protein
VVGGLRYKVVCIAWYEVLKCCREASLKFVATRGAMFAARIMTCDRIVNPAPRAQNISLLSRVFLSRFPSQSYALTEYPNFLPFSGSDSCSLGMSRPWYENPDENAGVRYDGRPCSR